MWVQYEDMVADLDISELFFTRTDERGIIRSGNTVFQNISGFPWEELIGAPHKIVRHDAMPKGVFHLMWDYLKAGKPLAAYVQNQTKEGGQYWVIAAALPVEGGYVSFRMKPSCGILKKIKPIYEELRAREKANDLTPEQSAQELTRHLGDLDYHCYDEFAAYALKEEVLSRDGLLGLEDDRVLQDLGRILKDVRGLETSAGKVNKNFRATHQIPYNMRLQAGRLEGSDGPISVISANHRQMTQTLEEQLSRFSKESSLGAEQIRAGVFKTAVARLIGEVEIRVEQEEAPPGVDIADDLHLLQQMRQRFRKESLQEVHVLADNVRRFGNRCRDMRRLMSGLELTRIMCKIERSKFDGEHAGLDEIVNRLADAQVSLNQNFDEILETVGRIVVLSEEIWRRANSERRRFPRQRRVA